jgi:ferritin
MKFVHFMLETGTRPTIPGTPELRNSFESPEDAIQFALDQEKTVTAQIDNLVRLAVADSDYASHNFLQWFVTEQVEEVDTMSTLLQTVRLAGDNLLLADDYVGRYLQDVAEEA